MGFKIIGAKPYVPSNKSNIVARESAIIDGITSRTPKELSASHVIATAKMFLGGNFFRLNPTTPISRFEHTKYGNEKVTYYLDFYFADGSIIPSIYAKRDIRGEKLKSVIMGNLLLMYDIRGDKKGGIYGIVPGKMLHEEGIVSDQNKIDNFICSLANISAFHGWLLPQLFHNDLHDPDLIINYKGEVTPIDIGDIRKAISGWEKFAQEGYARHHALQSMASRIAELAIGDIKPYFLSEHPPKAMQTHLPEWQQKKKDYLKVFFAYLTEAKNDLRKDTKDLIDIARGLPTCLGYKEPEIDAAINGLNFILGLCGEGLCAIIIEQMARESNDKQFYRNFWQA